MLTLMLIRAYAYAYTCLRLCLYVLTLMLIRAYAYAYTCLYDDLLIANKKYFNFMNKIKLK